MFQLSLNPSTYLVQVRRITSCACLMYVICFIYLKLVKRVWYYSWFVRFTVISICLYLDHVVTVAMWVFWVHFTREDPVSCSCTKHYRPAVINSLGSQIICSSCKQLWDHCCLKEVQSNLHMVPSDTVPSIVSAHERLWTHISCYILFWFLSPLVYCH